MYVDRSDSNRRTRRKPTRNTATKDYRPGRMFMVAVPVHPLDSEGMYIDGAPVRPEIVKVGANSAGAAIEGAKTLLVARKLLKANVDIRFRAVATEITAQIGDTFEGDEANKRAKKTSLDTLKAKVFA